MNDETRETLRKMSTAEQEKRLKELTEELGIIDPKALTGGGEPEILDVPKYEEFLELKRLLGLVWMP